MTKDLHNEMSAALTEAARVVAGVPQDADLSGPTLCTDWDLRTLLNHTILWTSYSAERRAHGESVSEDLMNKDFTADPGFRDDYAHQAARAAQAWSAPSAWEGELAVMGNATPAADVGAMLLMETVLHGWDVAAATGQAYRVWTTPWPRPRSRWSRPRPRCSASTRASPTRYRSARTHPRSIARWPWPAATPRGSSPPRTAPAPARPA